MTGKLIAHKFGEFPDKDTGEMISYDKFIVMGNKQISVDGKGSHYRGYDIKEYRAKYLERPSEEYDCLINQIVVLVFDQVFGSKNPELVDIKSVSEEVKK